MKCGRITPGSFNISKWFRAVNFEITLWQESDKIEFKKYDPRVKKHVIYKEEKIK